MRFQKIGLTTVVLCTVGIQQSFSIDIVLCGDVRTNKC